TGFLGSDTVPPTFLPGNYDNRDVQITPYKPARTGNGETSHFDLYVIEPTQAAIDWDKLKGGPRPSMIRPEAWDAVWEDLRPQLGETLAEFWRGLTIDSEKLAASGEQVDEIDHLFNFELQKANNLPAVSASATALDVNFPAPGLPLVFGRSMGDTIAGRYQ